MNNVLFILLYHMHSLFGIGLLVRLGCKWGVNNVLFILYHMHAIAKQHFSFSSTYISNRVTKSYLSIFLLR